MNKTDPNPPAYPMDFSHEGFKMNEGLTIRQEFAKAAMQGLVSGVRYYTLSKIDTDALASRSVDIADSLIKALNRKS